jgi:hypothetical protein
MTFKGVMVASKSTLAALKVHKIENFFDFDFGICVISLLVMSKSQSCVPLKVHKIEIFFGFDFEICIIPLLAMSKY